MLTWVENLFYAVFLGQIFLLSYYFPQKILSRMRYVLESYPPSIYPKLYPKPVEYYRIGQSVFKVINQFIFLLGFLILLAMLFLVDHGNFADDGFISEAWPAAYGMIQFLPLAALELLEFSQFKLMRKANLATRRKAELRRRGLFGFVSPTIFGLAVVLYLTAVLLDVFAHRSDGLAMWLTGGILFMAAVGAWNLYGRKMNPHQAIDDRAKQIAANLNSLLYISMVMSAFFIMAVADEIFDLDFLDAILMSVYFQVIMILSIGHVLRNLKLEDIDFDVYKNRTATT